MLVAYTVAEEPKSRKAEGHGGAQFFSNILPWKIKKEINFPHVKRDHLEKLSSPSPSLSLSSGLACESWTADSQSQLESQLRLADTAQEGRTMEIRNQKAGEYRYSIVDNHSTQVGLRRHRHFSWLLGGDGLVLFDLRVQHGAEKRAKS